MVNCTSKGCVKCKIKNASFNWPNQQRASFCGSCSLPGMVNVRMMRCSQCSKHHPLFCRPDAPELLFCANCKQPGMERLSKLCGICEKNDALYDGTTGKQAAWCLQCSNAAYLLCGLKRR
jgi:hypothetical protein